LTSSFDALVDLDFAVFDDFGGTSLSLSISTYPSSLRRPRVLTSAAKISSPESSSSTKAKSSSSLASLYDAVVFLRADDLTLVSTAGDAFGFVGVDFAVDLGLGLGLLLEAK
jgi:hypothetical protein